MKKLYLIIILISCVKISLAQKNFEGEIDYKIFGFNDVNKNIELGDTLKILFGKHTIKIESFAQGGVLWQEELFLIDSLKEIVIDYRDKTYREAWRANKNTKVSPFLPWGMNKVQTLNGIQKVAGYETHIIRLTDSTQTLDPGRIDLNSVKSLSYKLPPKMLPNLFIRGLLIYDDHIMLGIKIVAGQAPHSQINYVATKVEAKEIDSSEFNIPAGYTYKILK